MAQLPRQLEVVSTAASPRWLRTVALSVCFLLLLSSIAQPLLADEAFKPFRLKTVDGEQKNLSDVLGAKATVIVFFYPTCKYCNVAAPELQKLYDTYKTQGLSMVWLNAVPREARLVPDWRSKHGYTVPILVGASLQALDKDYDVTMTPTHYLLAPDGEIIARHAGWKAGDARALEQAIIERLSK